MCKYRKRSSFTQEVAGVIIPIVMNTVILVFFSNMNSNNNNNGGSSGSVSVRSILSLMRAIHVFTTGHTYVVYTQYLNSSTYVFMYTYMYTHFKLHEQRAPYDLYPSISASCKSHQISQCRAIYA